MIVPPAKQRLRLLIYDLLGSLFLGIGIDCFAVRANFAPGGVTGLSVMANYLFGLPIGFASILINVPLVLLTWKRLGKRFFLLSAKSILISSFFVDYVAIRFPAFTGSRLAACILSGLTAGIGYSLFFNEGSSTGGTDFIIAALKQAKPELSFGVLAFIIDGIVITLSVFVFRELWAFVFGLVFTVTACLAIDGTTKVLNSAVPSAIQ